MTSPVSVKMKIHIQAVRFRSDADESRDEREATNLVSHPGGRCLSVHNSVAPQLFGDNILALPYKSSIFEATLFAIAQ